MTSGMEHSLHLKIGIGINPSQQTVELNGIR
jgi:hypothetical protein